MRVLLIVSALMISAVTFAQNDIQTVFSSENSYGGFGAVEVKLTPLGGNVGLFTGTRGGLLVNHRFAIGGGRYQLSMLNPDEGPGEQWTDSTLFSMNYGGMFVEYIAFPKYPVHLSFPLFLGMGNVSEKPADDWDWDWNFANDDDRDIDWDLEKSPVFVIEPGIHVEMSLLKHVRFGIGGGYRLVMGSNLTNVNDNNLSNFSINMSLKFGAF